MKDIDKRKKGIQADVDGLRKKVTKFGIESQGAVKAAGTAKKNSDKMKTLAETAIQHAESASENLRKAEEFLETIDTKIKETPNKAFKPTPKSGAA